MSTSNAYPSIYGTTLLITGCCIGAGMIGFPVRTALAGFIPSTVVMILCYLFTTITGLLILEATLWFDEKINFATIVESTLGKYGKLMTLTLFLALFYSLFVAYLDGTGSMLNELLFNLTKHTTSNTLGIALSAAFVAMITYAGTNIATRFNQLLVFGLMLSYLGLIVIGLSHASPLKASHGNLISTLNIVPILLISFGYQNLVPGITYHLNKNAAQVRTAIILGNMIPLLVYIVWNYVILSILSTKLSTDHAEMVTQLLKGTSSSIAIILLIKSFSFFALFTSFIPNAMSLVDFIKDALKKSSDSLPKNHVFYIGIVFIPSFLFTVFNPNLFLNLLDFAGGFIDVILFGILPALVILIGRKASRPGAYEVFGGKITPTIILILSLIILAIKIGVIHG